MACTELGERPLGPHVLKHDDMQFRKMRASHYGTVECTNIQYDSANGTPGNTVG